MQSLRKNLPIVAVVLVVAAAAAVVVFTQHRSRNEGAQTSQTAANENCGLYRNDRDVTIGKTKIVAETANNLAESQKGLGGRPCIPENRAMLFGFTKPGYYPFWMKDMRFPIDIIWINSAHKVVGAARDVKPGSYPQTYKNSTPAQYVLELKANRSKELNISYSTVINF